MFKNREQIDHRVNTSRIKKRKPSFAFIDADNVWKTFNQKLIDVGISEKERELFEFQRVFQLLEHDRCYAYSAVEDPSTKPLWLRQIEESDGFILKLGTLTEKKGQKSKKEWMLNLPLKRLDLRFHR